MAAQDFEQDSHQGPLGQEHELSIAAGIILSLITFGLYNVYWNYREMKAMNRLLGREEYHFVSWLLLSLVTCGIYHIYYEYKMGADLYAYLKESGYPANPNLPIIGLILSCLGMTIVADAIYQHEINRLVSRPPVQ